MDWKTLLVVTLVLFLYIALGGVIFHFVEYQPPNYLSPDDMLDTNIIFDGNATASPGANANGTGTGGRRSFASNYYYRVNGTRKFLARHDIMSFEDDARGELFWNDRSTGLDIEVPHRRAIVGRYQVLLPDGASERVQSATQPAPTQSNGTSTQTDPTPSILTYTFTEDELIKFIYDLYFVKASKLEQDRREDILQVRIVDRVHPRRDSQFDNSILLFTTQHRLTLYGGSSSREGYNQLGGRKSGKKYAASAYRMRRQTAEAGSTREPDGGEDYGDEFQHGDEFGADSPLDYNLESGDGEPLRIEAWSIYSSMFFVTTVVTTIGYGHIAPQTALGKLLAVVYALLGIPLLAVFLSGIGDKIKQITEFVRRKTAVPLTHKRLFLLGQMTAIMVVGFTIFFILPAMWISKMENWSFMDALYYSFISLSTIGFGDYVAGQLQYPPAGVSIEIMWCYRGFLIAWIVFGLAWLSSMIALIQETIMIQARAMADRAAMRMAELTRNLEAQMMNFEGPMPEKMKKKVEKIKKKEEKARKKEEERMNDEALAGWQHCTCKGIHHNRLMKHFGVTVTADGLVPDTGTSLFAGTRYGDGGIADSDNMPVDWLKTLTKSTNEMMIYGTGIERRFLRKQHKKLKKRWRQMRALKLNAITMELASRQQRNTNNAVDLIAYNDNDNPVDDIDAPLDEHEAELMEALRKYSIDSDDLSGSTFDTSSSSDNYLDDDDSAGSTTTTESSPLGTDNHDDSRRHRRRRRRNHDNVDLWPDDGRSSSVVTSRFVIPPFAATVTRPVDDAGRRFAELASFDRPTRRPDRNRRSHNRSCPMHEAKTHRYDDSRDGRGDNEAGGAPTKLYTTSYIANVNDYVAKHSLQASGRREFDVIPEKPDLKKADGAEKTNHDKKEPRHHSLLNRIIGESKHTAVTKSSDGKKSKTKSSSASTSRHRSHSRHRRRPQQRYDLNFTAEPFLERPDDDQRNPFGVYVDDGLR